MSLGRLRVENDRLARLLDLRGLDTTPSSEQLAVPMVPGMVTMASPVDDKLALYARPFPGSTRCLRRSVGEPSCGDERLDAGGGGRMAQGHGSARRLRYLPLTPR